MQVASSLGIGLVLAAFLASIQGAQAAHRLSGNLVESANKLCKAEASRADPHQVPGAFEACIAKKANSAPAKRRGEICKLAVGWRGFMSKGKCYIDAE